MVKPKKYLGQHFLKDENIAERIATSLSGGSNYSHLIEIGPGMGVLTKYLLSFEGKLTLIEIDNESVRYLKNRKEFMHLDIVQADFLRTELEFFTREKWAVIGNFPYNISSQLFFRFLEFHNNVEEVVCMLQKEVAERIASPPGNKKYGILSVFLQAYYTIEYLFSVPPDVFDPPPKVDSGVIRLRRNEVSQLNCNESLFRKIVKTGFQNRRKTLRNALKPLNLSEIEQEFDKFSCRAEELSVEDFVRLTRLAEIHGAGIKI